MYQCVFVCAEVECKSSNKGNGVKPELVKVLFFSLLLGQNYLCICLFVAQHTTEGFVIVTEHVCLYDSDNHYLMFCFVFQSRQTNLAPKIVVHFKKPKIRGNSWIMDAVVIH